MAVAFRTAFHNTPLVESSNANQRALVAALALAALGENCATAVSAPRAKRLTQPWHKERDAERFQNPFYCKPL